MVFRSSCLISSTTVGLCGGQHKLKAPIHIYFEPLRRVRHKAGWDEISGRIWYALRKDNLNKVKWTKVELEGAGSLMTIPYTPRNWLCSLLSHSSYRPGMEADQSLTGQEIEINNGIRKQELHKQNKKVPHITHRRLLQRPMHLCIRKQSKWMSQWLDWMIVCTIHQILLYSLVHNCTCSCCVVSASCFILVICWWWLCGAEKHLRGPKEHGQAKSL